MLYTRRNFLKTFGFTAASLALPGCTHRMSTNQDLSDNPNFVIIMADDLGYGDIGCYGNTNIKTPHLDALAEGGMRFTDFHSNGPVCTPTRAALLTGRYQQRSGLEGVIYARGPTRQTGMALEQITFAEVLKEAGYTGGLFGKWHLGYRPEFNPIRQGFDEFRGYVSGNVDYHSHIDGAGFQDWWQNDRQIRETGYVTDLITNHAVRFIEHNRDRPFCLYMPHESPHYPYQGRDDKADRVIGNPEPVLGNRRDRDIAYKEMIEAMDDSVGRIVQTLRESGLEERTFIFFCSDNGPTGPGSAGPLQGRKGSLWEGGHRVPAIAYRPVCIEPGSVTDQTAMTMDIFPTMLRMAAIDVPAGLKLDGVDLGPVFLRRKELRKRKLFWRYNNQNAMRHGPWKLIVTKDHQGLYNLDDDIAEKNNLIDTEAKRAARMKQGFKNWQKDVMTGVKRRA